LDNLICKKSEGEVSSDAEGGEHSYAACALSWLNGDVTPVEIVLCSTSQLRGCSLPSLLVPSAHQTRKVLGDNDWLFRYLSSAGIRAHFRPIPHESSFSAMVYEHMPGEPHSPSLPLHLRQRCFRLGQPERHLHGAIHRDGRG